MTGKGQSCFLTVRRPFPVYPDKQTIIRVHRHVSKVPIAVIDFQSTCVSFYHFVGLQRRTCDDEAQRIRGIAIYNESDGLPSRSPS